MEAAAPGASGTGGTSGGSPSCRGAITGRAGCTLGVIGLYSGATGDDEPWCEDG